MASYRFRVLGSLRAVLAASWPGLLLGATLALICTIVGLQLHDSRTAALRSASTEAADMAAVLTQDIARNLEFLDLSIQGVVDELKKPAVMALPVDLRRLILFDHAATAPYIGAIKVVDTKGDITLDSRGRESVDFNVADRDYFKAQVAGRPGLYIGHPITSRTDGHLLVGLSRRIEASDGTFAGIVEGGLHLAYFQHLFATARLGQRASLALFRDDGTVLMREPYDAAVIGKATSLPWRSAGFAGAPEGEFQSRSVFDGTERLVRFRRVGAFPLVLTVALKVDGIYADWRRKAAAIVAVLLLCCAIIVTLAVWLSRELQRRVAAEANLVLLAEEDGLTGLANRRRFDEALDRAWRAALRHGTPLSLLMIDADQFKAFNDTFGHLAGDDALRALAGRLTANLRRPGDLAARYGGEEFAVVLPGTGEAGATEVAEAIRAGVLALHLPHPCSRAGTFSVSIGVATRLPRAGDRLTDLVGGADAALYASKAGGRNRSTLDRPPMEEAA